MAASTRIVSLNLGSQTVGLAEFRGLPNGGLILIGYRLREILGDHGNEAARNAQITTAVREMMAELGIKSAAVNYSVPAQSVFARFVKLPAVEEEKIERIIAFEAQQNVPFPLEEVVWDYQLAGGGGDEQIQVVLVAIKSDLVEGVNAAVEATGLRTSIVGVSTMALYNAFRYTYWELEECSLLIDIGARTTNLLFIEPRKIFSRSVSIAGSSISAAIAKEFNEAIGAAEFRKKRDGLVSLGGSYAEPADPDVGRVAKIVRSTLTRLHAEVMRSVSYYRSQQQGSAPVRVFLAGGTASLPYIREFFHEKLQLPVEFFHPLRNVTVAEGPRTIDAAASAHALGELVGLALRSTTKCPMELNLRPASVVRATELTRRQPYFILAAVCLILGLIGWGIYYTRAASVEREATARLTEKVEGLRRVAARMDTVRKQTAALDTIATPLISAINDRTFWTELIEDLNARLPKEDIWITELNPLSGGKAVGLGDLHSGSSEAASTQAAIAGPAPSRPGAAAAEPVVDGIFVRGLYLFNPKQQEVVVDYFRNLLESPFFSIDPNNQSKVIRPTTPTNSEWAFPYELRLDLKKPLKLP